MQIDFENYIFFSASEGAHPPQTPPVPTDVEGLSGLNLGAPSFEKSWIHPCHSATTIYNRRQHNIIPYSFLQKIMKNIAAEKSEKAAEEREKKLMVTDEEMAER